jgi:GNAT superfamily N-acetyltransferase
MQIRPALPADAMEIAAVHVRSWQAAYAGILPAAYLAALRPEDRAARYDLTHTDPAAPYTQIAIDQGRIIGFATALPSEDAGAGWGEVRALYVDPDCWGHGAGSALLRSAEAHLARMGFLQAALWVLTGNHRAAQFYERHGWMADSIHRTDTVWGITVEEDRFWRKLPASEPFF